MGDMCCKPYNETDNEVLNNEIVQKAYNDLINPETGSRPSDYFNIPVQWSCTSDGSESQISIEQFKFSPERCRFEGGGSDEHGKFTVIGTIAKEGSVMIKLLYEKGSLLWKRFEGKLEENMIKGTWKSDDSKEGEFTLELVTTVWSNDDKFVALKGLGEFVGVARFDYGFGAVSGTPTDEDKVKLNIIFGDGKTGTFQFVLSEESLKGKLESPMGEEELELFLKNEFE